MLPGEAVAPPREGAIIVLLLTFFAGCIRLFVERAMDDQSVSIRSFCHELYLSFFHPKQMYKETYHKLTLQRPEKQHDTWLWWFAFSLILAILLSRGWLPSEVSLTQLIFFLAINTIIAVGYFCWIYVGLFNKMTRVHNFSARAARGFLGYLFTDNTPIQAVVIGPQSGGKTTFLDAAASKEGGTAGVQFKPLLLSDSDDHPLILTAIDTPGENIGDHISVVSRFPRGYTRSSSEFLPSG